jgi:hypothetical protein
VRKPLALAVLIPGLAAASPGAGCDEAAAEAFATTYFEAAIAKDCESRLAALGANADALRRCRVQSRMPGQKLRNEWAERVTFRFKALHSIDGRWVAEGEYLGPDWISFDLKASDNNYCEEAGKASGWTRYPGLSQPGKDCGEHFWEGIPDGATEVAVLLECREGRWFASAMSEREFLQRAVPKAIETSDEAETGTAPADER